MLSYCRGGSLCDTMGKALETQCPLPESKVHVAFVQLCGALHYCHRHGVVCCRASIPGPVDSLHRLSPAVSLRYPLLRSRSATALRRTQVHRDIKLDNLCWTDTRERTLMLIDFGYAATANEQTNFAGSPAYAAPEVHHALQPDSLPFMCTQVRALSPPRQ